jgi:DNA-binding response OmpR family regulator
MAQEGMNQHGVGRKGAAGGLSVAQLSPSPSTDGRHDVLVVEDDPEINQLVGAYAELAGFRYRAALTGTAALAEVRHRRPSVIVLDLMLPDIDGLEICRRMRAEFAGDGMPVIILTALESEQTRRSGIECGASEYLTKPFDPEQLMTTIARHAGRVRG